MLSEHLASKASAAVRKAMQTKDYDGVHHPSAADKAVRNRWNMRKSDQPAGKEDPLAVLDEDDRRPCYDPDKSLASSEQFISKEPPEKAVSPEEAPEEHLYPCPANPPCADS